MWLFTTFGFFSIVEKAKGDTLTVRARVRSDLDRLRERYLPSLSETVANAGTDYPYRATASRADVADAMRRIAEDTRYGNFKNAVRAELGPAREALCHDVWQAMFDAESKTAAVEKRRASANPAGGSAICPAPTLPSTAKLRYGGVIVNEHDEILLYEPRGHFGGYVWTYPKGTAEAGESPEQCALREVQEEVGVVHPAIIGKLPGVYRGTMSETVYFLMEVAGGSGEPGTEAVAVRWVSVDEAAALIEQTKVAGGRARDLQVLKDAAAMIAERRRSERRDR